MVESKFCPLKNKLCSLFVVVTLATLWAATPAFGYNMPSMSDQNMGNMSMKEMSYDVMAGGKNFKMMITSTGTLPINPKFSEEQKSITFNVSGITSQDFVHYEITIPTKMLSGNLTVALGSVQVKAIADVNDSSTTIHINVPSSFVKSNNIADSTTLTITGTQAIPEFPISASIVTITAFAILSISLIRNSKFRFSQV